MRVFQFLMLGWLCLACLPLPLPLLATPANKAALERHFDRFLAKELNRCTTCHLPSDKKSPETLAEFPHNPFGDRLRALGLELAQAGSKKDIPRRLAAIANEDSDGDGIDNETELLLGHNPGDPADKPSTTELALAPARRAEFAKFLTAYPWRPFETVERPAVPAVSNHRWARNPIDAFIASEHSARGLHPRVEAPREILLRRVYMDLIGLGPTPAEQQAFLSDMSSDAYETVVNRLLDDARHGERWGRHWMDVWRYSDWAGWTDGGQVRDSKPHIWRWRDWIVESLNANKPYDRMVMEMLAADELAPDDTHALRATGFLVRNYKLLSREQWLEDTIKHTGQAFLGVTLGCAKCHNHMTDPITQKEYYQVRAIFEPHQVRTDRMPGQTNTVLDGLVRAFDAGDRPPTWLFDRGDERHPDTNHVIQPGVPAAFGGNFHLEPVSLPPLAAMPDKHDWVIHDIVAAAERAVVESREALARLRTNAAAAAAPEKLREQELTVAAAEARQASLVATLRAEKLEDTGRKDSDEWQTAALAATDVQRQLALAEARLKLHQAGSAEAHARADLETAKTKSEKETAAKAKQLETAMKNVADATKALEAATTELAAPAGTAYHPRPMEIYPAASSGRRLALARWLTDRSNPLTARVAMNHIWMRHFGRALVPTPADFGRNGRPPSHPQLLDWLAAEFMARGWSMKEMHRLIVTSSTYRMASTPDPDNASLDPDNVGLWRMNSRRLEAEAVRDNLLYVAGNLDPAMGGPDIDHKLGLTSKRRSLYLRIAAEKEVEFLKIFDGPSVTECYERKPSVVPQQALALANSELALAHARLLAAALNAETGGDPTRFVWAAFRRILGRHPTRQEEQLCARFQEPAGPHSSEHSPGASFVAPVALRAKPFPAASPAPSIQRARENLILVLLNHNDFVTIR